MAWYDDLWQGGKDAWGWAEDRVPGFNLLSSSKVGPSDATKQRLNELSSGAQGLSKEFLDQLKGMGPSFAPVMSAATVAAPERAGVQTVDQTAVAPNERMTAANAGTATNVARTAVAPMTQAAGITLDPTVSVARTTVGPAAQAGAAAIDRADLAVRTKQLGLANEFDRAMRGAVPSVAQAEFERNRDRNVADQMRIAALYGRGSNLGLALRQLATNTASINNQAAADTAALRAREIADARTGAGQALAATRGQDIDVSGRQADLTTDVAKTNAALTTDITRAQGDIDAQAARQDAQAANTRAIAQGDVSKAVSLANQDALNKALLTQAQIDAEAAQQNAAATNDMAKTNAQFVQTANQTNATQTNDRNATQAQLDAARAKANADLVTTNNQYNATQGNTVAIKNADLKQNAAANNQDAQVTTNAQDIQRQNNVRDAALTSQGQAITATDSIADAETAASEAASREKGATLGAVGGMAMMASDKRLKTKIEPGDKALREFLDAMAGKAKEWSYAEPNATTMPPGRHVSPMAQDLEKAGPAGKAMVHDTPKGKMVAIPQATLALLAAVGDLHKRLDVMERR